MSNFFAAKKSQKAAAKKAKAATANTTTKSAENPAPVNAATAAPLKTNIAQPAPNVKQPAKLVFTEKKAGYARFRYELPPVEVPTYVEKKDINSGTKLVKKPSQMEFPSLKRSEPNPVIKTTLNPSGKATATLSQADLLAAENVINATPAKIVDELEAKVPAKTIEEPKPEPAEIEKVDIDQIVKDLEAKVGAKIIEEPKTKPAEIEKVDIDQIIRDIEAKFLATSTTASTVTKTSNVQQPPKSHQRRFRRLREVTRYYYNIPVITFYEDFFGNIVQTYHYLLYGVIPPAELYPEGYSPFPHHYWYAHQYPQQHTQQYCQQYPQQHQQSPVYYQEENVSAPLEIVETKSVSETIKDEETPVVLTPEPIVAVKAPASLTNATDSVADIAVSELSKSSEINEASQKLTKGQAEMRIQNMVDEWLFGFDVNEVKETWKELYTNEYNAEIIIQLLNKTLESNVNVVTKTAGLFVVLFQEGMFMKEEIIEGFKDAMEMLEDLSIDVPEAFKFMGIYTGALMAGGIITLTDLLGFAAPLLSSTSLRPPGPKLLAEIFKHIKIEHGEDALKEMLSEEIDLEGFWPVGGDISEWKKVNGLSCIGAKEGNKEDVAEMKDRRRLAKKEEAFSSAITLINEPAAI